MRIGGAFPALGKEVETVGAPHLEGDGVGDGFCDT